MKPLILLVTSKLQVAIGLFNIFLNIFFDVYLEKALL